jgi:hypothetical protein
MAETIIVHFSNEDPIVAEVEALPEPSDNFVRLTNPRRRDGKALYYVTEGATAFIFPMHRITFIEIMAAEDDETEIVGFFRE